MGRAKNQPEKAVIRSLILVFFWSNKDAETTLKMVNCLESFP